MLFGKVVCVTGFKMSHTVNFIIGAKRVSPDKRKSRCGNKQLLLFT